MQGEGRARAAARPRAHRALHAENHGREVDAVGQDDRVRVALVRVGVAVGGVEDAGERGLGDLGLFVDDDGALRRHGELRRLAHVSDLLGALHDFGGALGGVRGVLERVGRVLLGVLEDEALVQGLKVRVDEVVGADLDDVLHAKPQPAVDVGGDDGAAGRAQRRHARVGVVRAAVARGAGATRKHLRPEEGEDGGDDEGDEDADAQRHGDVAVEEEAALTRGDEREHVGHGELQEDDGGRLGVEHVAAVLARRVVRGEERAHDLARVQLVVVQQRDAEEQRGEGEQQAHDDAHNPHLHHRPQLRLVGRADGVGRHGNARAVVDDGQEDEREHGKRKGLRVRGVGVVGGVGGRVNAIEKVRGELRTIA